MCNPFTRGLCNPLPAWPGVIYHNSDLDRFVEKTEEEESRRKTVEAPSETGGLLGEFEGKVEKELAEFLETTSQGRCSMTLGGVKSGQGLSMRG